MICLLIFINSFFAFTPQDAEASKTVIAIAGGELGVREVGGNNRGKRVAEYLRYVGLPEGHAWCAAFVCWTLGRAGMPNPRSAWCPDLFRDAARVERVALLRSRRGAAQAGDVFGIWFRDKGRIAHVGFVERWGSSLVLTIEGNTNEEGSREGDGVWRRRRPVGSLYAIFRPGKAVK